MSSAGSGSDLQAIVDAEIACRHLEEEVAELFARLHDACQEEALKLLQQHVAAARADRQRAATEFPPAQRARCQAQALLQQNRSDMEKLQESIEQEEKDLQGIRRSLKKLQDQIRAKQKDVDQRRECMDLLRDEEAQLHQQMEMCQKRTEEEHAEQETLAQHVADERTKRMELKAACRQKIKKVEEGQSRLQSLLESRGKEIATLREEVQSQESSTATSLAELARSKEEADAAAVEAAEALRAKQEIEAEHAEVQTLHGELRSQLEDSRQLLDSKTKEQAEHLAEWRLTYMNKLDAKIESRRQRQKALQASMPPKMMLEPVTVKP